MACSPLSLMEWRIESGKAAAAATDAEFYGPTAGLCVPTERRPRPRPAFAFGSKGKDKQPTCHESAGVERGRCGLKGFVSRRRGGGANQRTNEQ